MTNPDDLITGSKLLDRAWAGVLALGGLVWQAQESRMEKISAETDRNRDVAAKIFDKLAQMSDDSHNRHERLLNELHAGLSRKVDK